MILRKTILIFLATAALLGGTSYSAYAQSEVQEYNVKAAFLYRFTDYVEGNSNGEGTFNIAVLGNSHIIDPLKAIASDKKIKNKKINVRQYNNIDDIVSSSCQLLFISKNYTPSIESVVAKLYDKPTLIITEQDGGCARGAHINFFTAENKLKFEVNLRTARRSGLKISSQLLQHAYIYN